MSYKSLNIREEVKKAFDEWQWESRSNSQTQALTKLLKLAGKKIEGVKA